MIVMAATNQQLLRSVQTSKDLRAVAEALTELAERAENNAMLQGLLRKIRLRTPFDRLEYIKPRNRKGYWGRIPYWRENPTPAQLRAKLVLSETAYSLYGERGVVKRLDGTRIPRESHLVGEIMRGRRFVGEEELAERRRQKFIERISSTCGQPEREE